MNTLIEQILEAHGGLARWKSHDRLSAHLSQGGILWPLKGHGGMLDEVDVKVDLKQMWTSHAPFGAADRRTAVTPQRAAIETADGRVADLLDDPRASFAGFVSDYATVDGVSLPTRHLIYVRNPDGGHSTDPLVVSIVVSDVRFG